MIIIRLSYNKINHFYSYPGSQSLIYFIPYIFLAFIINLGLNGSNYFAF